MSGIFINDFLTGGEEMRQNVIAALMILGLALGIGTAQASTYEKITIATEGAYAPWNFTGPDGKLEGFEVDLAEELCKRMGVSYTLVSQAWDGIIPSLTAGKYDAIMAGMTITPKREKVVSFSRYYAATPSVFIVLKDSKFAGFQAKLDALTLDDISPEEKEVLAEMAATYKGSTVGVQTATIQERFLTQFLGDSLDIKAYDTQENLEMDLAAGRVDAAIGAMSYWVPRLETEHGQNFAILKPGMTKGPFGQGAGIAVRKDDTELAAMFTKAINEMIADGSLSRLAVKWFTFDASAKE